MSDPSSSSTPQFFVHRDGDHVAVAVADLEPGTVHGVVLATDSDLTARLNDRVPLGHKFALVARAAGEEVVEYGVPIGIAHTDVAAGDYVHVHNLRSARWPQSAAS